MHTHEFVRDLTEGWSGTAKLWKVSPPVKYGWKEPQKSTEYVITSAVNAMFSGPETYIFPADEQGETLSMGELPGSLRGSFDHEGAISALRSAEIYE